MSSREKEREKFGWRGACGRLLGTGNAPFLEF